MKFLATSCAIAALAIGGTAQAAVLDHTDFSAATNVEGNSTLGPSSTTATSITFTGNSDRTAVSNSVFTGDFTYSGTWKAIGGDNDTMGVTFGYVDGNNNYRLGWEGGGDWDFETGTSTTGGNGLWLIEESGGVATELFELATLFWTLNTEYTFSLTFIGNQISFVVKQGAATLASSTVTGTRSTDGKVGVYANSQGATFTDLDVTPVNVIPLPAGLPLLLTGLGGLALLKRRRKR